MISGDSTASHMGSVKNIEKARERRTFEVMPGSAATGIPDELQEHAQTIHPRMGYDMSDSLFMQQQQAAGRDKESKRALEERTALEAFRAAALQKPFQPSAVTSAEAGTVNGGGGASSGGDGRRKEPPPPLAGIKLRKKTSRSGGSSSSPSAAAATSAVGAGVSSSREGGRDGHHTGDGGAKGGERTGTAEKRKSAEAPVDSGGKEGASSCAKQRDGGDGGSAKKNKKRKKGSKKSKADKHGKTVDGRKASSGDGGGDGREGAAGVVAPGAGLGLGLVAYSSGDENDDEET